MGSGLRGEFLLGVGRHVHERRHDHGHLLQVRFLDPLVHVHIRVVGSRLVFDGVLDELKSGQADLVEGNVVGAAGAADGKRGHAHGLERLHPFLENGPHRFVSLQVDAANFSRAVIHIEIGRKLGVFGLELHFLAGPQNARLT